MSKIYKFAAALSLFASISLIVACSSSTSSSGGSGQIPTGQYVGNLNGQTSTTPATVTSTKILMDLTTELTTNDDGASTLSAPFASVSVIGGTRCFSSATTSGETSSVNGDRLTLGMQTDQRAVLRLTGRFNDDTFTGTFTLTNSTSRGCNGPISGGFDLKRN